MNDILTSAETIAIIGCSSKPSRTSHRIAEYLQNAGYRILPVNPNEDSVLSERSYPDMNDIPKDIEIDIVNIFRNSKHTEGMVEQVLQWSERTGQKPVIWTQLGVSSEGAMRLAEENGLPYIRNRCIMVEHRNLD